MPKRTRTRTIWRLSITPRRKRRVFAIAVKLVEVTGKLFTEPEAVGFLIDEKFEALGLVDNEEPAGETAGAASGENVAG